MLQGEQGREEWWWYLRSHGGTMLVLLMWHAQTSFQWTRRLRRHTDNPLLGAYQRHSCSCPLPLWVHRPGVVVAAAAGSQTARRRVQELA